jgi:urocanate hydratase
VFRTGYCDRIALSLDEALDICEDAVGRKRAVSVGLVGTVRAVARDCAARR